MSPRLFPSPSRTLFWSTILIAVSALAPLILTRYPPLHDYPFHLARIVILSQLDNPYLSRFYTHGSFLLPNIGMDAVAVPLSYVFGPERATRIFVGLTLMTALFGAICLHRAAHGRTSPWPLLAVLLLHNGIFRFGFFNYLFGMGLALAAAGWWMRQDTGLRRFVIGLIFSVLLMLCHFEAFAVFAVIAGSVEIEKAWRQLRVNGPGPALTGLVLAALPFLACLALFILLSPTASAAPNNFGYLPGLGSKPVGGLFSLSSGNLWLDAIAFLSLGGIFTWLAVTRNLTISKPLAVAVAMMVLAYFVVPSNIMGAQYADVRLGPALALLVLAALDIRRDAPARFGAVVLALAVVLGLVRSVQLSADWQNYQTQITPIAEAIQKIEPGSTLFAATAEDYPAMIADTPARRAAWSPPLKHVAAFAVLGTPVFVPMVWASPTQQPLAVRPAYRPVYDFQGDGNPVKVYTPAAMTGLAHDIQDNLDRRRWPALGRVYLLVVGAARLAPLKLPPTVVRAAQGKRFVLLRFTPARR